MSQYSLLSKGVVYGHTYFHNESEIRHIPGRIKHFLDTVDRPACLAQPSTISTRVLRVLDKDAPFALVEIFEIEGFEGWERDTQSQVIQDVIRQWPDYGDVTTLKSYQGVDFPVNMLVPGA